MSPRRYPSRPDDMPLPEPAYQALQEHEDQLSVLTASIEELDTWVKEAVREARDEVKEAVREIKASNGNETRKLIAAIAGSALTVLGGVIGMAKLEHHDPPLMIPRSVLDVRLDQCRPLGPGPSREECFTRVLTEVERP